MALLLDWLCQLCETHRDDLLPMMAALILLAFLAGLNLGLAIARPMYYALGKRAAFPAALNHITQYFRLIRK